MKKNILIILFIVSLSILFSSSAFGVDLTNDQCLSCHGEKSFAVERNGEEVNIAVDSLKFKESIHGTNECITCHGEIKSIPHVKTIYGFEQTVKINEGCMGCHADIAKEYKNSVHGIRRTAFCSDCHGSHNILKKEEIQSQVNRVNISKICMKCHTGEIEEAYLESFHGKANHLGSRTAASCADCHGSHLILGPNDPQSLVSKIETPKTCAKCHLVARENFANGIEHSLLKNSPGSEPMYYTFKFFIWLTIAVISLLFIHMEMELYRIYKKIKKG